MLPGIIKIFQEFDKYGHGQQCQLTSLFNQLLFLDFLYIFFVAYFLGGDSNAFKRDIFPVLPEVLTTPCHFSYCAYLSVNKNCIVVTN